MRVLVFVVLLAAAAGFVESHSSPYKLEFLLSAKNLPTSNSNKNGKVVEMYAVVSHSYSNSNDYVEVGKTSFMKNGSEPAWRELFRITVNPTSPRFRTLQKIRVDLYDHDPKNADEFYGYAEFLLDDLLHSFGNQMKIFLKRRYMMLNSQLIVKGREYGSRDEFVDPRFFHPTQTIVFPKSGSKGK